MCFLLSMVWMVERGDAGRNHIFVGPKVGRISMPVWSMISDVSFEFGTICFFVQFGLIDFDAAGLPDFGKALKFGM